MANSDFLKLLGLIIDKLSEENDIDIDLNEELFKYLESNGYENADIDKAFKLVKRLMNIGREEKEKFFISEDQGFGIRIYTPEETFLYNHGVLKRLFYLRDIYFIEDEVIEEIIDILLGLSVDDEIISEDFIDSLLNTIFLDNNSFDRIAGISSSRKRPDTVH